MEGLVLSVCLITYNQEKYVAQAIESILAQKINFSWEIIVADDFSTDRTREIINDYYLKYPQLIKLLFQPKNVGPQKNFIAVLNSAKGKYVAYLEGDDFWTDPNKLDIQIKFLEENKQFVACFHNVSLLQNNEIIGVIYPENRKVEVEFKDLAQGDYLKICSLIYKNNLSSTSPLINFLVPSEDTSLSLCLLQEGKAYYISKTMAAYRLHEKGIYSGIGESKKWLWSISSQKKLIKFFSFRSERFFLIQTKWKYYLELTKAYADEGNTLAFGKTYLKSFFPSFFYKIPVKEILYPLYYFFKHGK